MQKFDVQPVIIAGGSGTRLWPVSRSMYPKQFISLTSNELGTGLTMLQQTVQRLDGIKSNDPIVICNDEHRFLAAEQLRQINCNHAGLILEPVGRNTAPAICLAALRALELNTNPLLLILPADHHVADETKFSSVINEAADSIKKGQMVTFGITPDKAATGYGYIKVKPGQIKAGQSSLLYQVEEFVEKPNSELAQQYLASGQYLWNSGIFMFYAEDYLAELSQTNDDIRSICKQAWDKQHQDLDFIRVDAETFSQCPSDSIDYAVMEHTKNAYVMPLEAGWSDVGGWSALADVLPTDEQGNALVGDIISVESHNNYVRAEDKLVALLGVEDLIVVDTKDALLVAGKDQAEEVKKIVHQLNQQERTETSHHRVVYRPWGHYDSMDSGDRFQVKRISVKPGAKLSLQMHCHRAEHWVVVSGTARVQIGEEKKMLGENESVYIPVGEKHSLENPGKISLELIEVQSGSYLGEDDIVRFEDLYGRS